MVEMLEEILAEPIAVIKQMASQAKLGRVILAVGDEIIFYYVPKYEDKKSSISGRLRLKNVVKKRVLRRKNYLDKDIADLVYEEALKINEDLRGIRNQDGSLPNMAVVSLSDRVYNALNQQGQTLDEPEDVIVKYQLKRYQQGDRPEVIFRLYKAPDTLSWLGQGIEIAGKVAKTPIGIAVDVGSLVYKVVTYFF